MITNVVRKRVSAKPIYDLAVIGAGPGGYVASIKASQFGLKTICIDNRKNLGGASLNVGCIPSKTLLKIAKKFVDLQSPNRFGLSCENPTFDWGKIQSIKNKNIQDLSDGIKHLFKKYNVDFIFGNASFANPHELSILEEKKESYGLEAKNYLIATGCKSKVLNNFPIDKRVFVTSTEMLSLDYVPKRMVVIGAGVIGIELGSIYKMLGTDVTFIESGSEICPSMDQDISKEYRKYLLKDGFKIHLNTKFLRGEINPQTNEAIVYIINNNQKTPTFITADLCLLATGRVPNLDGLNLQNLNIEIDKTGRIKVNQQFQTSHSHIYAIGDAIAGPMLAHKAEEEGRAVAEYLAGHQFIINYDGIPKIIYTDPEIASVGKTQQDLASSNIPFKVGLFPMIANSRTKSNLELKSGFVKIIAHRDTDRILGGHIISQNAGEMIHEISLAIQQMACAEDIAKFSHAHPTLSEGIKESAMIINSKAIHFSS